MISFTYFMSYFINNEGHGQTISLLINLLFGTLGSSAVLILRTNEDAKIWAIREKPLLLQIGKEKCHCISLHHHSK